MKHAYILIKAVVCFSLIDVPTAVARTGMLRHVVRSGSAPVALSYSNKHLGVLNLSHLFPAGGQAAELRNQQQLLQQHLQEWAHGKPWQVTSLPQLLHHMQLYVL